MYNVWDSGVCCCQVKNYQVYRSRKLTTNAPPFHFPPLFMHPHKMFFLLCPIRKCPRLHMLPTQMAKIKCFQIFGSGFPNIAKTSDFEYRIRSFVHQKKQPKRFFCIFWVCNNFFISHYFWCRTTTGDYFLSLQEEKHLKSVFENRSNIRISRNEFQGSNIRFSEYEYSSVEDTD